MLLTAFFLAGVFGSYILIHKFQNQEKTAVQGSHATPLEIQDLFTVKIFSPVEGGLRITERSLARRTSQTAIAEAVTEEYFKGSGGTGRSSIPTNVKFLGAYRDSKGILYLDLSDELRRNFRGDALSEYLLLKGLYETLITNISEVQDVKILLEGKEIETLGGHFFTKYPLKNVVGSEFKGDKGVS